MEIEKYLNDGGDLDIISVLGSDEALLALISFDSSRAVVGLSEECMEHHILLAKMGLNSLDIDKYFRIAFDGECADWTFVCPPDYMGIDDKPRRIRKFYADGYGAIARFLAEIGLCADIRIPQRYKRHLKAMSNENGHH